MTDRRLYLRIWLHALGVFEARLRVRVGVQRNRFIRAMAEDYAAGNTSNHPRVDHEAKLAAILFDHYKRVMPHFGDLMLKPVKSRKRYFEHKAKTLGGTFYTRMLEWAQTRALNNASTIADTDMGDVRRAIEGGLSDGLGNQEIARDIRSVTELTPYRASTIARTETQAAASFGAIEEARNAEQEIGIVLVKEWVPTLDNRTRPAHRDMANSPGIPLDQDFMVGGEAMDRPGDPKASAENVINCRCALFTEEAPQ